jgi:hypothetical protein
MQFIIKYNKSYIHVVYKSYIEDKSYILPLGMYDTCPHGVKFFNVATYLWNPPPLS